jgi:hypothetical protein
MHSSGLIGSMLTVLTNNNPPINARKMKMLVAGLLIGTENEHNKTDQRPSSNKRLRIAEIGNDMR